MFKLNRVIYIAILCLIFATLVLSSQTLAQTTQPTTSQQLQEEGEKLQRELQDIERQIGQYEKELQATRTQKNTLARKLKELQVRQAKVRLQIQQTELHIQDITKNLTQTTQSIESNTERLEWLRSEIGAVIRELHKNDQRSYAEVLLSEGGWSEFGQTVNAYKSLSQQLALVVDAVRQETAQLEERESMLTQQREEQENFVALIDLQNQELAQTIQTQNTVLAQAKSQEDLYQAALTDTQKKAAQIRGRIYSLFGVGKNITFGEAVEIARWVSGQTKVRAAFLLAILTQESNLGKNVGTCNRPGDPPAKSWQVIMKPTRDQEPFKAITAELGLDPDSTPVSCPLRDKKTGEQIGWGGAMGPAQFIPSTWMGYKNKVSAITGKTADPWDIRDAFIASAIKLAADGATSESGEWAAAMRYFSGSTNPKFRFYGDSVMALTEKYEADIEELDE